MNQTPSNNQPQSGCPRPSRKRGAVLLAVLGMIFLMAVLAVHFLETATLQMRSRLIERASEDFRTIGFSALEVSLATIHEISEIDGGLKHPSQGWGNPLDYLDERPEVFGTFDISVTVTDETSRLSLETMDRETLRALLDYWEVSFSQIEIMLASFEDWTDPDDLVLLNGAEDDYYERLDPPMKPANAPLTSYAPLRHIRGFSDNLFDEDTGEPNATYYSFVNATSLHHSGTLNINTAQRDVLDALAEAYGFDVDTFYSYISGPDRVPGTSDDSYLAGPDDLLAAGIATEDPSLFGFTAGLLRVEVKVSSGDKSYLLTALVSSTTQPNGEENLDDGLNGDENQNDVKRDQRGGSTLNDSGESAIQYPFKLVRVVENMSID